MHETFQIILPWNVFSTNVLLHFYYLYLDDDMDGEAICVAFGTVSGPDCLSSVIKTLGTRLKVYKFLKDIFDAEFEVFLRL